MHFDNVLQESTELDYLKLKDIPYISNNVYKEYLEQVKQLDEMERIWVEEIVKRNLSIKLFSTIQEYTEQQQRKEWKVYTIN